MLEYDVDAEAERKLHRIDALIKETHTHTLVVLYFELSVFRNFVTVLLFAELISIRRKSRVKMHPKLRSARGGVKNEN